MHQSCMHAHAFTTRRELISSSPTASRTPQDQTTVCMIGAGRIAGRRQLLRAPTHSVAPYAATRPLADPAGKTAVSLLDQPGNARRLRLRPMGPRIVGTGTTTAPNQPNIILPPSPPPPLPPPPSLAACAHASAAITTPAPTPCTRTSPRLARLPCDGITYGRSTLAVRKHACLQP